eukprot:g3648.t1
MVRKKKKNKKPKPVAPVRHLMQLSNVTGWGEIDESKVKDYGENGWEPDELFQRTNVFSAPGQVPHSPSIPLVGPSSIEEPDVHCYLLLVVPPSLEYIAQKECERLWSATHEVTCGRIVVAIHSVADLYRANSLRCCSAIRVMLAEFEDYVLESEPDHEVLSYVTNEVQNLPWEGPYQAWAMISGNGPGDPYVDLHSVHPPPSFRVSCTASDAPEWTDEVCKSFERGVVRALGWDLNPLSPHMDILVEIQNSNITFSIELKKSEILDLMDPSFQRFKDNVVTYTLVHIANLKCGDAVFNASCGVLDISAEVSKCQPGAVQVFGDNRRVTVYDAKQKLSRWNRQGGDPEGCIVQQDCLPFRDESIDVLFALLGETKKPNEYQNTQQITRQLKEIARVCRRSIGRVVLLAKIDEDWIHYVIVNSRLWHIHHKVKTQFGEFQCLMFILRRGAAPIAKTDSARSVVHPGQGSQPRSSRGSRSNLTCQRRRRPTSASSSGAGTGTGTTRLLSNEQMDWNSTL